jgi:ubiquinone/menaquinone biosynthesis C-methylase UbiE
MAHVCPWWGGYFIDNRLRRWLHDPVKILGPHVQPGMTVMDIGCGMGLFAIAMAQLVGAQGRVIAVDIQPQMLKVLARRARAAGVAERITLHHCEATSIGVAEPVDFALTFYCVHEVPDAPRLLGEIHRCLRPGAKLLVVEPRGHVSGRRFESAVSVALGVGFELQERPAIHGSRAVLLRKQP